MMPNREIRIPGNGLLPPSTEPLPPADLKPEERVRVYPPCPPWQPETAADLAAVSNDANLPQFDGRYWRMQDAFEEHPKDAVWKNKPRPGPPPYGSGYGIDALPEVPVFEFKSTRSQGGLPDFWEGFGLFIVSSRVLEILIDADREAIEHRPIEMRGPAGELFDGGHHFVDVVRKLNAIDYANSIVDYVGGRQIEGEDRPSVSMSYVSSRIVDGLDPSFKIFRQAGLYGVARSCFVTRDLKERIEALSPRNLNFHPLYHRF